MSLVHCVDDVALGVVLQVAYVNVVIRKMEHKLLIEVPLIPLKMTFLHHHPSYSKASA